MTDVPQERRRHSRFPVQAPVPCLVTLQESGAASTPLAGKLRNISVAGTLLELGMCVPPGAIVAMGVLSKTGSVKVEGEVIWVTAGSDPGGQPIYVHGVQVSTMEGRPDPVLEDLLRAYARATGLEAEPPD